jgi:hypothetical protein
MSNRPYVILNVAMTAVATDTINRKGADLF